MSADQDTSAAERQGAAYPEVEAAGGWPEYARQEYLRGRADERERQVPVTVVCDWLVAALNYGVDTIILPPNQLPPGITRRDLAEAWTRVDGEPVEDHDWCLSVEGLV